MDNPEQATGDVERERLYAWAAGFIDGDGSLTILHNNAWNRGRGYVLRLEASGVDRKPLERLVGLFGGTISNGYGRPIHSWRVDAGKARNAAKAMLPYLTAKRSQAELVIRFQNHVDYWERWRRAKIKTAWQMNAEKKSVPSLPDHVFVERAVMRDQLKAMHIRAGRQPAAATTESSGPA